MCAGQQGHSVPAPLYIRRGCARIPGPVPYQFRYKVSNLTKLTFPNSIVGMTASLHIQSHASSQSSEPTTPASLSHSHSTATAVASPSYTQTSYDNESDPAYNLEKPLHGWPKVAQVLAKTPDFQAFPAFTDLNIKSLLYYQVELTQLREKLHEKEYEDYREGENRGIKSASRFARSAHKLIASGETKQWALVKQIRDVLKEYSMFSLPCDCGSTDLPPQRCCTSTILTNLRTTRSGPLQCGEFTSLAKEVR